VRFVADAFARINAALSWAPDWAIGIALTALAAVLSLAVYGVVERIAQHLVKKQKGFWLSFISRVRNLARAALVLIAVDIVSQSKFFPKDLSDAAARTIWVAVVLLVGWAVVVGIDVGAAYHLKRYKIDVADNLLARKHLTQIRILKRVLNILVSVITIAAALMTFPAVRQLGVSLFASAGAAGIVVGLAARPVLSNLIAGLQLAITQPIRIDDVVVVEGEFGNIEDIGGAFVVIRLWDLRRLVVPLSYFIQKPFQNYTRASTALIGTVTFQVDYLVPVDEFRAKAEEIVKKSPLWDGKAFTVQVTDFKDRTVELRVLLSAANSGAQFDLRCAVREELLKFLQQRYSRRFPRDRIEQYWHHAPRQELQPPDIQKATEH
jgi:small-conductance mechanosensitive channel